MTKKYFYFVGIILNAETNFQTGYDFIESTIIKTHPRFCKCTWLNLYLIPSFSKSPTSIIRTIQKQGAVFQRIFDRSILLCSLVSYIYIVRPQKTQCETTIV